MSNIFTKHPHSVGESYLQHCAFACCSGLKMLGGAIACIIHGIFPFLFTNTGSQVVHDLEERFSKRK